MRAPGSTEWKHVRSLGAAVAADSLLAASDWGRSEGTPEGNVEIPSQPKFSGLLVFGKPVTRAAHSCHSSTPSHV